MKRAIAELETRAPLKCGIHRLVSLVSYYYYYFFVFVSFLFLFPFFFFSCVFSEVKERSKKAKVEKKKDAKTKKAAAPSAFEKIPKSRRLASKPKATTR